MSFGQPSVENGQSHDENHVSSTSSSWRTGPEHDGQFVDVVAAHGHAAARVAVPDGNAMAPPELPRDVPVADVRRASGRRPLPSLGQDANASVAHRLRAPARRAASSSRTTGRTGAARPPCRSGSSAARRAGAARPSRAGPLPRSIATIVSRASKRSRPRSSPARAPSPCVVSRVSSPIVPVARRSRPASAARAAARPRSRSRRAPA